MEAKVAVAVIHGIGSQANKSPEISDERTFSDRLYRKLARKLGRGRMAREVAWREVFWADVLEPRQERYLERIKDRTRYDRVRGFVVKSISDAASFQRREGVDDNAYALIQQRVRRTIADLNEDTSDDTPLVILAHSFGGHILSNYVWDLQRGRMPELATPFQRMQTVRRFVTFGCNIPLFTFAYPPQDVAPIAYPGPEPTPQPWWLNYYDPDDVLAFPLAPIGPAYEAMAARGELRDVRMNAGGVLRSWNPLSHDAYWTDKDFVRPVAEMLRELL